MEKYFFGGAASDPNSWYVFQDGVWKHPDVAPGGGGVIYLDRISSGSLSASQLLTIPINPPVLAASNASYISGGSVASTYAESVWVGGGTNPASLTTDVLGVGTVDTNGAIIASSVNSRISSIGGIATISGDAPGAYSDNGGQVTVGGAIISGGATYGGHLTAQSAKATTTSSLQLQAGFGGVISVQVVEASSGPANQDNYIRVYSGGEILIGGPFTLSERAGDSTRIDIEGMSSNIVYGGPLALGGAGVVRMSIFADASQSFDSITMGRLTGGVSSISVTTGTLTVHGMLAAGVQGRGDVSVSAGSMTVDGLFVAADQSGSGSNLRVDFGGTITLNGGAIFGKAGTANVTIFGAGSKLQIGSAETEIGGGNGRVLFSVRNGGLFDAGLSDVIVGKGANANANLTIDGNSGGTQSVASHALIQNLVIGNGGSAQVNVQNGGSLEVVKDIFVGNGAINSSLFVTGSGSKVITQNAFIGRLTADVDDCGDWTYTGYTGSLSAYLGGYVVVKNILTINDKFGTSLVFNKGSVSVGGDLGYHENQLTIGSAGIVAGHANVRVASVVNNGLIDVKEGTFAIHGNVIGDGEVRINDKSTFEIDGDFTGRVMFNGGYETTLRLDQLIFSGTIGGLANGNTIELPDSAVLISALGTATIAHTSIHGSELSLVMNNGDFRTYQLSGDLTGKVFDIRYLDTNGSNTLDPALIFHSANEQIISGSDGSAPILGRPTGNDYVDALIWGWAKWNKDAGPITYWFGTSADIHAATEVHGEIEYLQCEDELSPWTQQAKDAFLRAIDLYSSITDLTFQQATSVEAANLVWWNSPTLLTRTNDFSGFSETPAMVPSGHLWQVFDDKTLTPDQLSFGGYGFKTIIHELGHALGLAHPHDGGDEPDFNTFPGVERGDADSLGDNSQNRTIFTTMSYNGGDLNFGNQGGLGAFDITALYVLYGLNSDTRAEDDVYNLPKINAIGTGWSCIFDVGGVDTISNEGGTVSSVIDLQRAPLIGENAGGYISGVDGIEGGFTIAPGTIIENAIGGQGDDALIGNEFDNLLTGNGGDDVFSGREGIDTVRVFGRSDQYALTFDPTAGTRGGEWTLMDQRGGAPDGTDILLTDVERIQFSDVTLVLEIPQGEPITGGGGPDNLAGTLGNDIINGLGGNDTIRPGAGNDIVYGGDGSDKVIYDTTRDENVIILNVDGTITVTGPQIGTDQLYSIERIDFLDGDLVYDIPFNTDAALVYRIYQASFARTPDEGGFRFWEGQHSGNGLGFYDMANYFRTSPEFIQKYGANVANNDYVYSLYGNVLQRTPDTPGLQFWQGVLNSDSLDRNELMLEFASSPENVRLTAPNIDDGYWLT